MARKASHCNDTVNRPNQPLNIDSIGGWLNQLCNYIPFGIVHWRQVIKMTVKHKNSIRPTNLAGLHIVIFIWFEILEVFGAGIQVKQRCLGQAATCWIE
jgi:hypothetical protein